MYPRVTMDIVLASTWVLAFARMTNKINVQRLPRSTTVTRLAADLSHGLFCKGTDLVFGGEQFRPCASRRSPTRRGGGVVTIRQFERAAAQPRSATLEVVHRALEARRRLARSTSTRS